jgi:hypothetical protein
MPDAVPVMVASREAPMAVYMHELPRQEDDTSAHRDGSSC